MTFNPDNPNEHEEYKEEQRKIREALDKKGMCEYCSLKCIASDCECTCHKEVKE